MIEAVIVILVHSFYSQECCANRDCHPVRCDEIVDLGTGWRWHETTFPKSMLRPSQDGGCHVCVFENGTEGICIYLPARV